MSWGGPLSFSYPINSKKWYTMHTDSTIPVPLDIGDMQSATMHIPPIIIPPSIAAGLMYLLK